MRPSQKQNRARGRGNRKPNGNVVNRVFESAGPEGKVRGTPQQIIDKYQTLARDAQTTGDRVMAENFLQHAEHYQRILLDAQGVRQEQRRDQSQSDQSQSDQSQSDQDGDGRDDSGQDDGDETYGRDQRREARRDDRGDESGESGGGRGGDERDQREERRQDGEVSGLTTIDSGSEDGDNLLVEAEDLSASQPPRRRRNQRRDKSRGSSEAQTADSQSE